MGEKSACGRRILGASVTHIGRGCAAWQDNQVFLLDPRGFFTVDRFSVCMDQEWDRTDVK